MLTMNLWEVSVTFSQFLVWGRIIHIPELECAWICHRTDWIGDDAE